MARRKKHMKLPNHFGSIKYLGKGRRRPYAVYPPVTECQSQAPSLLWRLEILSRGFAAVFLSYSTYSGFLHI